MELGHNKVFLPGVEVVSIKEFSEKYGKGVSTQALDYAMNNDNLDFIKIGTDRFIVMTQKSRSYSPNENKNRERIDL